MIGDGIKLTALCSFLSSQSTRVTETDGQADRQRELRSLRPR